MSAEPRAVLLLAAVALALLAAAAGYDGRPRWHRVALAIALACFLLPLAWDAAAVAW